MDVAAFAREIGSGPLALESQAANEQHYEVPAQFFESCLGRRMKYSACLFPHASTSLVEAEEEMLRLTCERAEISDGMRVLELGCGWGSLTLWIAEHFPNCTITALTNSNSQREFIEQTARQRKFVNVRVITANMTEFSADEKFDRIVSVEMFEHMRNYKLLFSRLAGWLAPQGKAFVHVFCHRSTPYLFETEGADNWMGRNFFTGGMMPSVDLFSHFDDCLGIEKQWTVNGLHYWRTCEEWLRNLDSNRSRALESLSKNVGIGNAEKALQRWRMFFMACAELFRYRDGMEWFVAHYLFTPQESGSPQAHRGEPALVQEGGV
ncbi:Cyclopropane-fatty-acyl-phospholipid synthase [Aureliella helgolandensis]|uniref:Cyclopropane-fatty-acyl-phospholipid synthase n=1 Tax=Aureliella helgolandensis TaxID=2527968 RepID=A0A518G3X9_9BACT|nr:Cyclopropane-fatty-acyl-phospholipid synthase [Aureliella helgolandensis]